MQERPPPISEEEQRLTEDNDALSHRYDQDTAIYCRTTSIVFGEPSDISTDCGASPQDVRYLFAYNAHPTDFVSVK